MGARREFLLAGNILYMRVSPAAENVKMGQVGLLLLQRFE